MRKHCRRVIRQKAPPMLVSRGLCNDELEIRERMAVEAFAGGWAGENEFDTLADMRNLLTIAAAHKDDAEALQMCDAMRIPMSNIRDRYARTGRMGVTGDELALLREFVGFYRDWWLRQSASLYATACDDLQRAQKQWVKA